MNPACSTCGKVSTALQTDMFSPQKVLCIDCVTNERADMMMRGLPNEEEWEYTRLSVWERGFLSSVRQQFTKKHSLSDAQYQTLEKIWNKLNR